jgi:DNA topoisomerase-1
MFRSDSRSSSARHRAPITERAKDWWRRRGSKEKGFWYADSKAKRITAQKELERIKSLVIPPAWVEVRISPKSRSPVQALGRDAKGRLQYLYHPKFIERQETRKFSRIALFGKLLPSVRRASSRDIGVCLFTKERVLAIIVRLINDLYFRVGSETSVRKYRTFGVTTLRSSHVTITDDPTHGKPATVDFNFVGKHHVRHRRVLVDATLAHALAELKELPGSRLFKYVSSDGHLHPIRPADVNGYIKRLTRPEFSAKDFRTWGGTLLAAIQLAKLGIARSVKERKKKIVMAVKQVAEYLGNTPAVCRQSYIHPEVLKQYEHGHTLDEFKKVSGARRGQRISEQALLALLTGSPLPHR